MSIAVVGMEQGKRLFVSPNEKPVPPYDRRNTINSSRRNLSGVRASNV